MQTNETIIGKPSNSLLQVFKPLPSYLELFYFLILRNIKIRYKQTLIGVSWVLIQPLLNTLIFSFVIGRFVTSAQALVPYSLFALSGAAVWFYALNTLNGAAFCFTSDADLVKKIYFPRILIPLATVFSNSFDFMINSLLLIACTSFLLPLQKTIFLYPLAVFFLILNVGSMATLLSILSARFRDLRNIIPYFLQLLFFLTPVVYPYTLLSKKIQLLLSLNPLFFPLELLRTALFGTPFESGPFIVSLIVSIFCALLSLKAFQKMEINLADTL